MTNAKKRFVLVSIFILFSISMTNCGKSGTDTSSTSQFGAGGSSFATPSGASSLTSAGNQTDTAPATINAQAQTSQIAGAVAQVPTDNATQDQAKTSAVGALQDLAKLYGDLPPGISPSQASPVLQQILQQKQQLALAAQAAQNAQLQWLAQLLADLAAKQDILRFYSPAAQRHFFTASATEGYGAGYQLEGLGFRVYKQPTNQFTVPIYRCYVPSANDHFISLDANCEGQNKEGAYGYIAAAATTGASLPLGRLYNAAGGHFVTLSQAEINQIVPLGWKLEAYLGYPPL